MLNTLYVKTITISDEVYRKLSLLKDGRSFSELIDELIRSNISKRIDMILQASRKYRTGREEELLEIVERLREGFKARTFEASP